MRTGTHWELWLSIESKPVQSAYLVSLTQFSNLPSSYFIQLQSFELLVLYLSRPDTEGYCGPFVSLGLDINLASHLLNYPLAESETQSVPCVILVRGLCKQSKQLLHIFFFDAFSWVWDFELNEACSEWLNSALDKAMRRVGNRVLEEVVEHLLESSFISFDLDIVKVFTGRSLNI